MSYDSITIPASGYVSLKKNGLSLSNIRMASIITYSRIDPPKPFCVYGNSTVAYVYGEPGTVITELKVRFWYWLNSKKLLDLNFGSKQELLLYLKGNTSKRFSFYFVTSVSDEMFGIAASMKGLCSPVRTSISSTGFVYDFFAYGSDNVCIARYNPSTGQVTVKKLNTDTAKVIDVL